MQPSVSQPVSLLIQREFYQEQPPASQLSMRQVALWTHDFDSLEYRQSKNIQENQSPQILSKQTEFDWEQQMCKDTEHKNTVYGIRMYCTLYPYLPYRVSCWRCTSACVHAWHSTEKPQACGAFAAGASKPWKIPCIATESCKHCSNPITVSISSTSCIL